MSGEREAKVRNRGRSFGNGRPPDRNGQCAEGTSSLSMLLVRRLASDEGRRTIREGSQMNIDRPTISSHATWHITCCQMAEILLRSHRGIESATKRCSPL